MGGDLVPQLHPVTQPKPNRDELDCTVEDKWSMDTLYRWNDGTKSNWFETPATEPLNKENTYFR